MKLGIIASSLTDLHVTHITQHYDHEYRIFLDNRFGGRQYLSREDSLDRLNKMLSSEQAISCDAFILPPIYELYARFDSNAVYAAKILPLYTRYIQEYVLPGSVVGKVGVLSPRVYQNVFPQYREHLVKSHTLLPKQQTNKHFQLQFPLYAVKTDHRDMLYDLPRSRFVNKLIKGDLKKLKDYAIDTLIPISYSYFEHEKVFVQTFHNNVKVHKWSNLEGIAKQLLGVGMSAYSVDVYLSGNDTLMRDAKKLMWRLCRGKQCPLGWHALPV